MSRHNQFKGHSKLSHKVEMMFRRGRQRDRRASLSPVINHLRLSYRLSWRQIAGLHGIGQALHEVAKLRFLG